ncbi:CTLH/CRA C-terminal to lish motif domain-domain-containing protein [Syncephalastrum racemosum]|uniref:CTLH/CRA C-terminal to lish motif domain-domain-containing protein n=1 Tax=Syncephalastrum racemosum TaxID=13706 RepID=A0A1X2H113_SYNRA|nr:CTLH/CRA C-terminal to lish motif domain-domain-containing protein [Syncephalastrum racemosum]
MNQIKGDQLIELEQPLIKVPYEQLRKSAKYSRQSLEKEMTAIVQKIKLINADAQNNRISVQDAAEALDALSSKLNTMKRKLEKFWQEERLHAKQLRARVNHLASITNVTSVRAPEFQRWSHERLNRVVVDYLLREGLTETAKRVAAANGVEDMVDVQLFAQSDKVEEALRNHSCKACLQWCSENRTSLKKNNSTLEFNLRLQEYIELARAGKGMDAIQYAQKYLSPWEPTEFKRIHQAMTLLAFKSDTQCQPYKSLYDPARWDELVAQFRRDNYKLCSLTSEPLLSITLQAGLSALKTPQCYQSENRNVHCPVCDTDTLGKLASGLPLSHHVNSTIVCRMSGKIINENNPPMLLPNGRVYSLQALREMADKNDGTIICPRTGDHFTIHDLRKVFIS